MPSAFLLRWEKETKVRALYLSDWTNSPLQARSYRLCVVPSLVFNQKGSFMANYDFFKKQFKRLITLKSRFKGMIRVYSVHRAFKIGFLSRSLLQDVMVISL